MLKCYLIKEHFFVSFKSTYLFLTHHTFKHLFMPVTPDGYKLFVLDTIPSTNTYAIEQIKAKVAQDGFVYVALAQTNGRGQRGKAWLAQEKANITLSFVLQPFWQIDKQFYLSMLTALVVKDFLNELTQQQFTIKWPNDIYYENEKIAGILIENLVAGANWQWAVIGVGININQTIFLPELTHVTSVKLLTGNEYDVVALANKLSHQLYNAYKSAIDVKPQEILNKYNNHLYKRGEKVKLKQENRVFEAIINGVDAFGNLHVNAGMPLQFKVGDVVWVQHK